MAKTREVVCQYYICEGECEKGRDAAFWGTCQKCTFYKTKKRALPVRKNNREKKKAAIRDKEFKQVVSEFKGR